MRNVIVTGGMADTGWRFLLLCMIICGHPLRAEDILNPAPPPLMPRPAEVSYTDGVLMLRDRITVVVPPGSPARVLEIADVLKDELWQCAGLRANIVRNAAPPSGAIILMLTEAGAPSGSDPRGHRSETDQPQ